MVLQFNRQRSRSTWRCGRGRRRPLGGVPGTTQAVWQSPPCELQLIMQFVTSDVCASNASAAATAVDRRQPQRKQSPSPACPPPRTRCARQAIIAQIDSLARMRATCKARFRAAPLTHDRESARRCYRTISSGGHGCSRASPRIRAPSLHPVLDDVADRDEADQAALIDHGHVAEFAGGHALHDVGDRFAFVCRSRPCASWSG